MPRAQRWFAETAGNLAVFLGFFALACILTWPLGRLLTTAVAYPGDPLINTWVLAWDVHAFAHAPLHVYDANIFFPARLTLALSENLFGLWPLAALLSAASPLAVHNSLLLLGIAFSAFGAFVLGRTLTGESVAGVLAGCLYGFCPWRFVHLAHLQHMWGGWLPLFLAALVVYHRHRTAKHAALISVTFLLNGLTNLHYLVFAALAGTITATFLWMVSRKNVRDSLTLAASLLLPLILLTLILSPYSEAQRLYGFRGDAAETERYSTTLGDWLTSGRRSEPERNVFPGAVALVAASIGLIAARRRDEDKVWVGVALICILLGVFCSTGPATRLYHLAFEHLPAIRGIRAPARWAVLAYLGMAVLGAIGVRRHAVLGSLLSVLAVVQVFAAPIRWYLMPEATAPVYAWLRDASVSGGILELPIGVENRDFYYLLGAASHLKPILNGASGGAPPAFRELTEIFSSPHIPDQAVERLTMLGTSHLVVHSDALGANRTEVRRWLRDALARRVLSYVGRFEAGISGDYVFSLKTGGRPLDEALRRFLDDRGVAYNRGPFGYLESPAPGAEVHGRITIRGWALSGSGIRRVRIWMANKGCFVDAKFSAYPSLQKAFPEYGVDTARFSVDLDRRPCGARENDLLVELTDHGGLVRTLPHQWFVWD